MKKIAIILAAILTIAALSSCSKNRVDPEEPDNSDAAEAQADSVRILTDEVIALSRIPFETILSGQKTTYKKDYTSSTGCVISYSFKYDQSIPGYNFFNIIGHCSKTVAQQVTDNFHEYLLTALKIEGHEDLSFDKASLNDGVDQTSWIMWIALAL